MVEFKRNDEEFPEYDPKARIIKINLWRPNLESLEEKHLNPKKFEYH